MRGRPPFRLALAAVILAVALAAGLSELCTTGPRSAQTPPSATPAASTRPGPTGFMEQASRAHPRQRFYLYVPRSYDGQVQFRLLVVIHGTSRRAEEYAEQFTDFADEHRYIILAPLFPSPQRYQQLGMGDDDSIRADLRLLELVDEVGARYRVETGSFDLFGFSGGGQFAHRFMYVHPERLRSIVAAAPGTVTLPTDRDRWPTGVADMGKLAGARFDLKRVRRVRSMLIVGEDDVESENLRNTNEANELGRTRLKRARTLHRAWLDAGIDHEYVEVPDVGHVLDERIARRAQRFLAGG